MNTVTVTPDTLVVEPHGMERPRSLRRLEIPLAAVMGAVIDPSVMNEPKGMRTGGIAFFGRYTGTFIRSGERSFWHVAPGAADRIVVVTLADEYFTRLVISVDDPQRVVRAINTVLIG
jgi:hypothetical protein